MDNLDDLNRQINERADKMVQEAEDYRSFMLSKLEQYKNDRILGELSKLNTRLDKIEARLPEEED